MTKVYLVRLSQALSLREALLDSLSGSRKEKALRFLREEDQVRSALGSLLIRRYAGTGDVLVGPKGKPYLERGSFFNLSHAGDFVGIAIADEEVGFDVEDVSRCDLKIVRAAFTAEEANAIHDKMSFAYAWTRKEAVAKCLGDGIWRPRESGLHDLGDGRYEYEDKAYFTRSQELDGHVLTIATQKEAPELLPEIVSASELLN